MKDVNSVGLSIVEGEVSVISVGSTVAAAFRLAGGPLAEVEPLLASKLRGAFAAACADRAPVSFDASLVGTVGDAPLLTRGIMLPLLDAAGNLTQGLAVLTWKEGLGATASDGLRDELGSAITAGRASCRTDDRQLTPLCAQPFTSAPPTIDSDKPQALPLRPLAWAGTRQTCYRAAADA